jgi:hypothetical protein
MRQRGIVKEMVEFVIKHGRDKGDKIILGVKDIKQMLQNKSYEQFKPLLLKILDKKGLVVVLPDDAVVTVYQITKHF